MAKKRRSWAVRPQKGPNEARRPTRSLLDAAWGASLLCSVLLVCWPALRGGRILDAAGHLTSPDLQSFHSLWRIWFDLGSTPQYYPLAHSAFWIEQKVWGGELLGYHLTNVLLHAAAALLVVAIVRRLALAAGLWLVARRDRGPLAGFLFFGGTLFPALGFLNVYPFLYSYVADHYQHLASLGIIVLWRPDSRWRQDGFPPLRGGSLPRSPGCSS